MRKKISVSWSGGKDSALALHKILAKSDYDVVSLHTVFNSETRRVGMHGVHESLIEKQAHVLNIPLEKLFLHPSESNEAYTALITSFYEKCRVGGIESILFGDIFLEDLKTFRDNLLTQAGLTGLYPLWHSKPENLINEFIDSGFKTLLCSANANLLPKNVMGKMIDSNFIRSLPGGVDPCGENGEFHTFVYDGPTFSQRIDVQCGEVISRDYVFEYIDSAGKKGEAKTSFWFIELMPS